MVIAGTTYHITKFKPDTFIRATYKRWYPPKQIDSVVGSIKKSNYDIEIRCHLYGAFGYRYPTGNTIIIRGTKDSLYAVDVFIGEIKSYELRKTDIVLKKAKSYAPVLAIRYSKLDPGDTSVDELLKRLLDNQITSIPDMPETLNFLKKKGVNLLPLETTDCCPDVLYEVKFDNQYRVFSDNIYYLVNNHDVKELQPYLVIDQVFRTLLPRF